MGLFKTALLTFRCAVIILCTISMVYLTIATDKNDYTVFKFLWSVLSAQFTWSFVRLQYDVRVMFFGAHLPGFPLAVAIVTGEMVLSCLTYAASTAAVATVVYLERDTGLCALMNDPTACNRYKVASLVALSASIFTSVIAVMMFCALASRFG